MNRFRPLGHPLLIAAGFLAAVAYPLSSAIGRSTDSQMETEIIAGNVVEDPEAGTQVFSKGFRLSQGTRQISAESATVYRNGSGGFNRIILKGDPARWTEELDDGSPLDARAATIEYDVAGESVRMVGKVEIMKAGDQLSASEVTYDLKSQKLDASGTDEGVLMRYKPSKTTDEKSQD